MKNRRDICFAKDAGSVSYAGLPGHIKTGCMAPPAFKSPFCTQHKDRSCSTVDHGNFVNHHSISYISAGLKCLEWLSMVCIFVGLDGQSTSPSEEAVIEMVLAVKETRGTKYYQVILYCFMYCMYCHHELNIYSGSLARQARCAGYVGTSIFSTTQSNRGVWEGSRSGNMPTQHPSVWIWGFYHRNRSRNHKRRLVVTVPLFKRAPGKRFLQMHTVLFPYKHFIQRIGP